ncbi:lysine--tRNA ligase [Patescibacteria group bacterium]|nr:lysine--tRNA ligase [Patescibacteria group bacterium]
MFWADRIAKEIQSTPAGERATSEKPLIIRDEKTMSGRVHIGSMRGVAIHGLISEVLSEYRVPNKYLFELNDFDPFDSIPSYLPEERFKEYLGLPLYKVPSPEPGFANYVEFYGADFISVHEKAGFFPEYYRATELYQSGKMNPLIKTALDRAADVRRILKEVSGSVKDESWLPLSVVCEKCGKIMTTNAFDFDGETVAYSCAVSKNDIVSCGHSGRVSPYGGNAKLFWKVDWAAKWIVQEVSVEGAGKDHSTKGGSRDVAKHIAKEIFGHEPPFDIPYEFFLVGGKKMSSSKGKGSSAKEMSELFPAEILRLVLIGKDINQQIEIDPSGDSIPRTFDWYDDLSQQVRDGIVDDFSRLFALCELPGERATLTNPWQLRFSQVVTIMQMPHLSLEEEAVAVKGSELSAEEERALEERAGYARFWLSTYAPDQYKYELQETLPEVQLSDTQKRALAALAVYMETPHTGEEVHARLHELKTEIPIQPKELFTALYRVFLNRDSGPKAGWFLSVLPREFVQSRLREASR